MGQRVLLFSINRYDFPYPVFPLGAAQVDAALRRKGHTTLFIDYNVNLRPLNDILQEFQPDIVGISLRNIDDVLIQRQQTFTGELKELCGELHRLTRVPVVLGGSGFSMFPEPLLEVSGADYGIQGEGEEQFPALIELLAKGGDPRGLPGLVYREGGAVRANPRNNLMVAQTIPIPEREGDVPAYYLNRTSMLNVQTQRGCALKCCYCTYPLLEGRKYRRRPGEQVAEELEVLERRGVRYVFVVDSVFNTSPAHVEDVCEAILRRNLRIHWCCFLRPKGLTEPLMRLMARAGLRHAEFGSDSFSDPVLEAYGKQLTFADILQSSELARKAQVDFAHFLICGGPGETAATLDEAIANSKQLPDAAIMARVGMRVYPETPLFERYKKERGEDLPKASLLQPVYYLAPGLTEEVVFSKIREAGKALRNWIVDDPPPSYYRMAERLRARGVVGPLWAYVTMMQRLGNVLQ